jgi:hypothetical protein
VISAMPAGGGDPAAGVQPLWHSAQHTCTPRACIIKFSAVIYQCLHCAVQVEVIRLLVSNYFDILRSNCLITAVRLHVVNSKSLRP